MPSNAMNKDGRFIQASSFGNQAGNTRVAAHGSGNIVSLSASSSNVTAELSTLIQLENSREGRPRHAPPFEAGPAAKRTHRIQLSANIRMD
jgi:hypothetical protein